MRDAGFCGRDDETWFRIVAVLFCTVEETSPIFGEALCFLFWDAVPDVIWTGEQTQKFCGIFNYFVSAISEW